MQHGVVVVALGRHQGHDTGRGHGVGDIAEILGTTGTGPVNEQTSRAWPGAPTGSRSTAGSVTPSPVLMDSRVSRVRYRPSWGMFAWAGVMVGVGRSDNDVLGVGPCVPLRHHRPAKCGEYQRHRHRGDDDARYPPHRNPLHSYYASPHQHRTVGSYRSAPVIMCFYWDRNAMVCNAIFSS